ncbi:hypothetical protein [Luteolibacter marinus]|uniref:hypothetical protein n=1 Tax=Luteolibacter marinus TaxID=2776705 RepID=UPI00186836D2|nr:hypothetical protein [Luteolibacter marinus]
MKPLRRYQTFFLLLLLGAAFGGVWFNTWVNPWRVTPAPWTSRALEPYRAIDKDWSRTAKAGLARSAAWDAAMFGSSRVDIGLDPAHPAFDGMRCVNLGLNAGLLDQNHAIFRYFIEAQSPKLVVLAIDASDLTTPLPRQNPTDFSFSPLATGGDPIERALLYRAGISTLAASSATVSRAIRHQPADHTPRGFRRDTPFPDDQRRLISSLYLSTTVQMARNHIRHGDLTPAKVAMVEEIVTTCQERGIRLVIFFTPNHALFQLAFREMEDPDPYFEKDRRALAEIAARANATRPDAPPVEVWDFLDGHPLNSPPLPPADEKGAHLDGWIDLFHATPAIGNRMLDRLSGSGDYGVMLTPDNIGPRIAAVRGQLEDYARRHPDDLAFLRAALAKFESRKKP